MVRLRYRASNNVKLRNPSLVVDVGEVADMDAWATSQRDHREPPMGDLSASSVGNWVISACIVLNKDLQPEPTVLDVVGEDMSEMNAPLGLKSRKTEEDTLLLLMIALIFLAFLLTCRSMKKWSPS